MDREDNKTLYEVEEKILEGIENKFDKKEEEANDWKLVSEENNKGSNVLKGIGMTIAVIGILVGMIFGGMKLYEYGHPKENESSEQAENNDITDGENVEEEKVEVSAADLEKMYDYVHFMANTIIIPEDGKIRGVKDITNDTIAEALSLVKGVDEYLYTEISKWKDCKFDNAVEVHNYVWKKLGGNEGKAGSLNKTAIEEAVARITQ